MIRITNLVKQYGEHTALNQLTMAVGKGVIFGLLGPNGAGKTTLVSVLNGLTDFQEGEITVFGLDLTGNLKEIRKRSTFIPQSLALYENLSVLENLRFFAGIQSLSGRTLQNSIDYAIGVNQLDGMLDQKASTLSGGQKRRLNIAIGLLNNPEILYFDEPTIGIDPESRNGILETIRSFKEDNKTVIYTSHYMDEIEKICDEVAIINHGRIVRQGQLQDMLSANKTNSAVIELLNPDKTTLNTLVNSLDDLQTGQNDTLVLEQQNSMKMAKLLEILEAENIPIKQIRYQSMSLESLFINLTSREQSDV